MTAAMIAVLDSLAMADYHNKTSGEKECWAARWGWEAGLVRHQVVVPFASLSLLGEGRGEGLTALRPSFLLCL
jgi:hypothetical protein